MSVKIRFARLGKPKNPFYRIVVMDSRKPRNSEYLDKVGHINPLVKREDRSHNNFFLDKEKIISWLTKGAQPTQVVLDILKEEKLWEDFCKQRTSKRKRNKRKSDSNPISEMLKRKEITKKKEEANKVAKKAKEAKQEAAKQEAAKQEAAKQEAAKQEAAKQEAAKQEEAKQEEVKQEAAKQEEAKQEAAKQEEAKQEEPKQEEVKQEEAKQEGDKS